MTAIVNEFKCIAPSGDICGEGPVWHTLQRALYWTDINRFLVHRYTPDNQATHTWIFEEPVTSVNLTTDSERLLLVFGSCVGLWSPSTHPYVERIFRLSAAPEMRFNDARVDPRGALWAGTMRNNVGRGGEDLDVSFENGVLYRIDPDGNASEWRRGVGISNTVAWSPDLTTFYFGDTTANAIYQFDYDSQTGEISNERPFLMDYQFGVPDGSAIDSQGYLWNTRPGASCLIRVAPDGNIDRLVDLPVLRPTCCTFGGDDLKTLYVTSARCPDRLSGSVFALRTEVGGVPDHCFELR
jgi:sugar lactone lactonase YvrE